MKKLFLISLLSISTLQMYTAEPAQILRAIQAIQEEIISLAADMHNRMNRLTTDLHDRMDCLEIQNNNLQSKIDLIADRLKQVSQTNNVKICDYCEPLAPGVFSFPDRPTPFTCPTCGPVNRRNFPAEVKASQQE